jgi:hypothetical protein
MALCLPDSGNHKGTPLRQTTIQRPETWAIVHLELQHSALAGRQSSGRLTFKADYNNPSTKPPPTPCDGRVAEGSPTWEEVHVRCTLEVRRTFLVIKAGIGKGNLR